MTDIIADVIVVGSGVAGALMAAKLSQQGIGVAVLEAGTKIDRSEAVDKFWNSLMKVPESAYPLSPEADHPITNDLDHWYRQDGPDKFKSTYIKVVGGTTWHWLGTALRLVPNDFRIKTVYDQGVDWPISYDEIEAFYAQAEQELGVSGNSDETLGSPRSNKFPMSAIPQTFLDKAFDTALASSPYQVRSTPQARNSTEHDDRPGCCGSASCIPICPVQAKYDATIHVDRAEKNGARLHERTTATFVEVGSDQNITAIRFKRPDGSEGRAIGKIFVIAAHAVETPRLLLNSRSDAAPQGVANGSDQVGRNLMDHPTQLSWAMTDEPVWPYRGPLATSGIENLRDGPFRKDRPAFRIEIGNDGWSWPTGAPITLAADLARTGMRGKELDAALKYKASRHIRVASLVEQLPDPQNRVTLDAGDNDIYGVPLPRITYRIDDHVKAGMAEARKVHEDIFVRLGTTERHHGTEFQGAGHIIGTARMGSDPTRSVVDGNLRSHQHKNLFILGSSVFPTSATANPTLTIAALSLRAVAQVAASLTK